MADEEKPLLSKMQTKQRSQIEEMEEIGSTTEGNPKFAPALQLSIRTAVWTLDGTQMWPDTCFAMVSFFKMQRHLAQFGLTRSGSLRRRHDAGAMAPAWQN